MPPETATAALYAAPTVPLGSEVVDTVKVLPVGEGFEVPLELPEPLHPARNAVAPSRRPTPHFRMVVVPLTNSADGEINTRVQEQSFFYECDAKPITHLP